ncbi:MAG: hypothetical protein EA341_08865 [Mongoliibacter sp.]|uniref:gliding motility-associated C-terminal domain-containing protein n=1 Tax=Mongoliibacter sp. TaxID=2022438 RepID=UPI0012F070E7|nr:gliding motility-associated C-terminal domain-containing protein [Mongoliibacter sp.]TVP49711.1 MAG: hypothetical protein EA341_08865 [Mongoliibacter sp.]
MKQSKQIFSAKTNWLTLVLIVGTFGFILSESTQTDSSQLLLSAANDFEILGPERVCLITGNRIEEFFGGGDPETDVYRWTITEPVGPPRVFQGGESLQTLAFTFSQSGTHTINLVITRGGIPISNLTKIVEVLPGAEIVLLDDYVLCPGDELTLRALDPSTVGLSDYSFEWIDENDDVVSIENELVVDDEGVFQVRYFLENSLGEAECENTLSTQVRIAVDFDLDVNGVNFCPGNVVVAFSDPQLPGRWYYEKVGEPRVFINQSSFLQLSTGDLPGFGDYVLIFELINENNPSCIVTKTHDFTFGQNPQFRIEEEFSASECLAEDGALRIFADGDIDLIYYVIDEETNSPGFSLSAGEELVIPGLRSGVYTFEAFANGCKFTLGTVVTLQDVPDQLRFTVDPDSIVPETCSEEGKNNGSFTVFFENGPIDLIYELYTERGDLVGTGVLESEELEDIEFVIEVPGGIFYFEVFIPEPPSDNGDGDDEDEDEDEDEEDNRCMVPFVERIEVPGLPQVEFSVPTAFKFCEVYELTPETSQPLEFLLRNITTGEERVGQTFTITEAGDYELIGRHLDFPEEICPTKVDLQIEDVDPVEFEIEFVSQDCIGNQVWEANILNYDPSEVRIRWYDEAGEVVSTGVNMSPVTYGEYELEMQPRNILGTCPTPPTKFIVPEPVLSVPVDLEASLLCPFGPDATITLDTDFDNVGRIRWRYFDEDGDITVLTENENDSSIVASISGTYEVTVYNSINITCEIGRTSIDIDFSNNLTQFDVPQEELVICERYEWIPESNFPLVYTLTYPNGEQVTRNSDERFVLNQRGEYEIRGADPNNPICPNVKSFEVRVVDAIVFSAELVNQSCEGEFTYEANFGTSATEDVLITWRNSGGQELGNSPIFTTSTPGTYTLEVQPAGSLPCDVDLYEFEIEAPVLSVNANLQAGVICPDDLSTVIELVVDMPEEVDRIEWRFTDINNNTSVLGQFEGLFEVIAEEEGTYEATVFNELGCSIGNDLVLIMRSMDDVRPVVKELYEICAEYEIGETINPGNFSTYEWYLDEMLVSTSPTYKPQMVGEYTLVVNSQENCEFVTTFLVEEECELRVSLPNAMIPGSEERNFLIYTNFLIDELDIWIFNKWGQEVFSCSERNLSENTSSCIWDGYYRGEKLPIGAYAVRIHYKNTQEGIEETMMTTLTVIN